LAGFQEDEGDTVLTEHRAEFVRKHRDVSASLEQANIPGILEAKPS
jgi:hypothetical protein